MKWESQFDVFFCCVQFCWWCQTQAGRVMLYNILRQSGVPYEKLHIVALVWHVGGVKNSAEHKESWSLHGPKLHSMVTLFEIVCSILIIFTLPVRYIVSTHELRRIGACLTANPLINQLVHFILRKRCWAQPFFERKTGLKCDLLNILKSFWTSSSDDGLPLMRVLHHQW